MSSIEIDLTNTRNATPDRERTEETQYAVMRSVIAQPGMTSRGLNDHVRANGWIGADREIRAAAEELQTMDVAPSAQPLRIEVGARRANLHYPGEGHTAAMWSEAELLKEHERVNALLDRVHARSEAQRNASAT